MTKYPIIRDIDNGDVVVDYGNKWFRCQPNGLVIAKSIKNGKVIPRIATSEETLLALGDAAFGPIQS